jgi:hypothetical protein
MGLNIESDSEKHTPLSLSRKNGAREQIELLARTNLT